METLFTLFDPDTNLFNATGVHSPIRWFGGKYYFSKKLIPLIPIHHCYVEPFGGGGHVLTRKAPSRVEVWNDVDGDLINFLMVLRKQKVKIIQELLTLPTSRYLTMKWQKEPQPKDELERAIRWFYLKRQTICAANNVKSGWRINKTKSTGFDYQNAVKRLDEFENRIREVMIECLDFREILKRYDTPDTFFFVDPPYWDREKNYKGNFTPKDHEELAELLHQIKGKAMVTYYPHPLLEEWYQNWNRKEFEGNVVGTNVVKKGAARTRKTEIVYMNY